MISIVMPIYNAEKYLRESVDAIAEQLNDQIELILVNDGSKDSSLDICREYAEKEKQIRVIDKANGGVSDARNAGISAAKGQYVLFADSDDIVEKHALSKILRELERKNYPDILIWGFSFMGDEPVFNDTKVLQNHPEGFDSRKFLSRLVSIDKDERIFGFIWRCAFKRSLLEEHKLGFLTTLKMSEDYKFLMDVALVSKRIETLDEELYIYRTGNASVTERYKSNVHGDMSWINRWVRANVCVQYPEIEAGLNCCCAETYICTMQNLCKAGSPYSLPQRIRVARKLRKENNYSHSVRSASKLKKGLSIKRRAVYVALSLHLDAIYMLLYSMKRKNLFGTKKAK